MYPKVLIESSFMERYLIFFVLALVAEILGTVSGFGSSILFVPIASLFFNFKTVLGITAVFHVFSNLSKIALSRKGIRLDIAIKLGIPAVIFVILGAIITKYLPVQQIELGMNIILIFLALFLIFKSDRPLKPSNSNLYLGGVTSGFIAGIAGTGGAIRGITLAAFQLPKDVFIATSALIDLGVDLSRAVVYINNGYFTSKHLVYIPFLIGISILGSYLGKLILQKTSERTFRYIILIVILITAAFQLYKYIYSGKS